MTSVNASVRTPRVSGEELLRVQHLVKRFPVNHRIGSRRRELVAVDDVSFSVSRGETLGIVGESGCGKSTLARCVMGLERPSGGAIAIEGRDLTTASKKTMRSLRRDVQMVFQDPYDSLNPRRRVGDIVAEPMLVHGLADAAGARKEAARLFDVVGLNPRYLDRYPNEFSGGQRQRVGIARALAAKPKILVADEPVSALDVSVQAQVLNLLSALQREFDLTYIFVSHNIDVVRYMSDRIAVMYLGRIVEMASAADIYAAPQHPYTVSLLGAIPNNLVGNGAAAGKRRRRIVLRGDIPSPVDRPSACPFEPRCPVAQEICRVRDPEFRTLDDGRYIACHFPGSLDPFEA
ncbi:MAG: peptide ABC transporter ATP-binding protein [Actinobacteria bacterium 69-20]|nr:ATP-binding cassette domain-containing protein [Actinomycetota bacterium]OJV26933.1 MAG: peptide ABC transporter ATP-binding protein [Actinobacteria bacterium 69-20]